MVRIRPAGIRLGRRTTGASCTERTNLAPISLSRVKTGRHNPWAPLTVLLQQPLYISSYRLTRVR